MSGGMSHEETLDCRGLLCPLPALKARERLALLDTGDYLVVLCTDPASVIDIPALCDETGDLLREQAESALGEFRFRIQRTTRPA